MAQGAPLTIYNSLTRTVEEFHPLIEGRVRVYSCGPTVYNYPHIGNLRPYVLSDTLQRALLWKGYEVEKAINITDVGHLVADADSGDDKLEAAARASTESVYELARRYENAFHADLALLRIIPAAHYPRATSYIQEMIEFATVLEARDFAYRLPTGLYFDTSKSPGYGQIAGLRAADQWEGARVEAVPGKRNKNDFAVWRTEQPGERRLMRWDSPWGWGAPGWHLECSVMSIDLLGRHFDIHTGGIDHRELHHVNEIAQSEAYLGDGEWVHYWLHNEFVNIKQAKMAKSDGGGLRLVSLIEEGYEPAAYRLWLLMSHYRSQTEFSRGALDATTTTLRRLRNRIGAMEPLNTLLTYEQAMALATTDVGAEAIIRIDEAVSEDLNTPRALAALQEALQSPDELGPDLPLVAAVAETLLGLGLDQPPVEETLLPAHLAVTVPEMLAERERARAARDWASADRVRDELDRMGIRIKDTPQGTTWELV